MNKKNKIFYGWYIVIACMFIMAVGFAPMMGCASLFIKPITQDLGFARGSYTITNMIFSLVGVFVAPIFGKILSTKNMHKVVTISTIGYAVFYSLFSRANSLISFYLIAFFLGIFAAGSTILPVSILITNWFMKKRGLAMSIALAGSGVGGAILSPLIGTLITSHGWRYTYVVIGIIQFVILVPLAIFVIRQKPEDKGLKPYGYEEASKDNSSSELEYNISLSELKKKGSFWIFIAGITLIALTGSIIAHIPAAITDAGYSTVTASKIASIYLAIAVPGKLVLGHIFDKYGAKAGILFGNTVFILSVITLLLLDRGPIMLYLLAILFGFGTCIGTVSVSVLTSKLYGSKNYAVTYGFVSMFNNAGFAFGVPILATIFDITGSYKNAWLLVLILAVSMTFMLLYASNVNKKESLSLIRQQEI